MARNNRNASNDIAALRGARLVKVSEFDDGERLAEAQIKTLTGGDPVTCRYLYQEYFTYTPIYKILLIGNHKPKVRGTDHGIWRRLHLLHFHVTIPEDERDPYLQDKLLAELPGVLSWAAQGCFDWQSVGLSPPEEIKVATAE
jgi:putative DNA primase/helicase